MTHCFGLKRATTPLHTVHSTVGEAGGGAVSPALKIYLIKRELHSHYHKKSLKITFLWKAPERKKFAEIFCKAFFIC
jgi:hypothetical protein